MTTLNRMLLDDAAKEYSLTSRTGFGIDAPSSEADNDFSSVRGCYESDPFVKMVMQHTCKKSELAQTALRLIEDC